MFQNPLVVVLEQYSQNSPPQYPKDVLAKQRHDPVASQLPLEHLEAQVARRAVESPVKVAQDAPPKLVAQASQKGLAARLEAKYPRSAARTQSHVYDPLRMTQLPWPLQSTASVHVCVHCELA